MKRLVFLCSVFLIIFSILGLGQQHNPAPPKPIIGAAAGDRQVTLYWDNRAEQAEDFEGYIIFRSTEPTFKEVQTITDGFGNPTLYQPIAQFDNDNNLSGPHPVAIRGIKFNLGENTGLVHTWTDSGQVPGFLIRNGQTYYYAVCSYDRGDSSLNVTPSISNLDSDFNFIYNDSNTVAIIPNAPAAGYIPSKVQSENRTSSGLVYLEYKNSDTKEIVDYSYRIREGDFYLSETGPGTGFISIKIVDPSKIKNNHTYQVAFEDTGYFHETVSYSVYDITSGDTLVRNSKYVHSKDILQGLVLNNEFVPVDSIEYRKWGPFFDGMSIQVFNHSQVSYINSLSGWFAGSCNYEHKAEFVGNALLRIIYPADYEIRFFDHIADSSVNGSKPTNFQVWNVTDNIKADFRFEDRNNDLSLSPGDNIYPIIYVDSNTKYPWKISFIKPITPLKDNYLELDGSSDYATAADAASLDIGDESTESLTIEAWIYPKSFGGYIIADEGYTLATDPGKGVKFEVKGGELVHTITMTDVNFRPNAWHHVVGIFDNTSNKLAVGFDGKILWSSEDTTTFNLKNEDISIYVGSLNDNNGYFSGAIDEVRMSDIVRYPNATYTADTSFTVDENTRSLWHFDEVSGSASFTDASGNGNDLTAHQNARTGPPVLIPPESGDVFRIHCTKPLRGAWTNSSGEILAGNVFSFETQASYSEKAMAKTQIDEIAVVPNPYRAAASWESNSGSGERERKIYFIHLPTRATIRIYTISGYLVDKIEHDSPAENGAESWDLKSKDGSDVAFGIYIYHIDAPGVGEKMGKFAVIK